MYIGKYFKACFCYNYFANMYHCISAEISKYILSIYYLHQHINNCKKLNSMTTLSHNVSRIQLLTNSVLNAPTIAFNTTFSTTVISEAKHSITTSFRFETQIMLASVVRFKHFANLLANK